MSGLVVFYVIILADPWPDGSYPEKPCLHKPVSSLKAWWLWLWSFLAPVIADGVLALVMAGGAGSGFSPVQCQCTGLKIPAFCCLTVLYGQESRLDACWGRKGFWCSYFAVLSSQAELWSIRMPIGWSEHCHVWIFRLTSAAVWMFRITSAVLFGCFVSFLIFPLKVAVKCSVKACWKCLFWVWEVILCRHRSGWVDYGRTVSDMKSHGRAFCQRAGGSALPRIDPQC